MSESGQQLKALEGLPDGADLDQICTVLEDCRGRVDYSSAFYRVAACTHGLLAAYVDDTYPEEKRAELCEHVSDLVYRMSLLVDDVQEPFDMGAAMLRAWQEAGGSAEIFVREKITEKLLASVDAETQEGLCMSRFHSGCNTSHCIAGWYAHLLRQPAVERAFGTRVTAYLAFAANHPGQALPYTGSLMEAGVEELRRLKRLVDATQQGAQTT